MIVILSPARNTRTPQPAVPPAARPQFIAQAEELVGHLRQYSPWQLESLLDVPPERAFDLYAAFEAFDGRQVGMPALLAYWGAAFRNMRPGDFTPEEMAFAQEHLRILSALYGLLRPQDGILHHRLGLKKDFSPNAQNLHAFWGDKLYKAVFATRAPVVNLASAEYAKLVAAHMQPGDKMLTCRFLVQKPAGIKSTVSTIRAARGMMARYIVKNRITQPEGLRGFNADGYRFIELSSTSTEYVFVKKAAYAAAPEEED